MLAVTRPAQQLYIIISQPGSSSPSLQAGCLGIHEIRSANIKTRPCQLFYGAPLPDGYCSDMRRPLLGILLFVYLASPPFVLSLSLDQSSHSYQDMCRSRHQPQTVGEYNSARVAKLSSVKYSQGARSCLTPLQYYYEHT